MGTAELYGWMLDLAGGNELLLCVVAGWLAINVTFWGLNAVLLYNDMTGKLSWLNKYKVQKEKGAWQDKAKLRKAVRVAINYMVIGQVPTGFLVYYLQQTTGCSYAVRDTPPLPSLIVQLVLIIVSQEILFYYSHRLLHHPWLYKRVHKMHHEWTAPIGLVSIYSSPAEYILSNGVSVLTGPLLMRCHALVFFAWYCCIMFITIAHHSGYHLPFCPSPEFHDYHHLKFNANYGTWGWLDYLHKTEWLYGDVIQKKRNFPLLGFEPMSEKIPDPDKNNKTSQKKERKRVKVEYENGTCAS